MSRHNLVKNLRMLCTNLKISYQIFGEYVVNYDSEDLIILQHDPNKAYNYELWNRAIFLTSGSAEHINSFLQGYLSRD